nr:hypothetical protein [uncultured Deinococcus sp.]
MLTATSVVAEIAAVKQPNICGIALESHLNDFPRSPLSEIAMGKLHDAPRSGQQ